MWQGELSSHEANLTKSWLTEGAPRQPVPVKGVLHWAEIARPHTVPP